MITEPLDVPTKPVKQYLLRKAWVQSKLKSLRILNHSLLSCNRNEALVIFADIYSVQLLAVQKTTGSEPLGLQIQKALTLLSLCRKSLVI